MLLRSFYFSVKGRVTEISTVVSRNETTGPPGQAVEFINDPTALKHTSGQCQCRALNGVPIIFRS